MIESWLRRQLGEMPGCFYTADTGVSDAGSRGNSPQNTSKTGDGAGTSTSGAGKGDESGDDEEEPFDKDRAMRLINRLRDEVKTKSDLQTQLAEATLKLQEHETAGQTELQRLQTQVSSLESKLVESQNALKAAVQSHKERIIALYVENEAIQQGVDPVAAAKLVDVSSIEVDDEDQLMRPKNVKKVVEDLIKTYPYLENSNQRNRQKAPIPPTGSREDRKSDNNDQGNNESRERAKETANSYYRANW